jgi:hypothetical protein
LQISFGEIATLHNCSMQLVNTAGYVLLDAKLTDPVPGDKQQVRLPQVPNGIYFVVIYSGPQRIHTQELHLFASH